jgi:hypothetical protein
MKRMKPPRPPGSLPWTLPDNCVDVTLEALETIYAMLPAPQVAPPPDAGHGTLRRSEKPRARRKKSEPRKVEMTLVQNPEAAEVAALFEQLTGRKPTAEEMREVEQTLNPQPRPTRKIVNS